MKVYNWENSATANHKKVKKNGTVVFRPDESVDRSFDRLQRGYPLERFHRPGLTSFTKGGESTELQENTTAGGEQKVPLMRPETAQALRQKMGFQELLPCQAQCYRGIFNARDVILHSRTGSGKTLAYALPIIERHFIVDMPEAKGGLMSRRSRAAPALPAGPFLLIFVFSNDLAVQTRGVLTQLYPTLRVGVAGFDDLAAAAAPYDVLIGTVRRLDEAIRGRAITVPSEGSSEANAEDSSEESSDDDDNKDNNNSSEPKASLLSRRRPRSADNDSNDAATALATPQESTARPRQRPRRATTPPATNEANEEEETERKAEAIRDKKWHPQRPHPRQRGEVCVAEVRAVVIDEVDMTLGPRFSTTGRRVKALLKHLRRANGSLTKGLSQALNQHHYVLCGATIPNWVLKAGFLGEKKYYYQLVATGGAKLPVGLVCWKQRCARATRAAVAAQWLTTQARFFGRVVVFGTARQLARLESALQRAAPPATSGKGSEGAQPHGVVRLLTSGKDELDRIAALEDFNQKVASVLLCTDIAARGLDLLEADTVLMLSLPVGPMAVETFVHRAGRTARVDRHGRCVVLYDSTEEEQLDAVAKSAHVVFRHFVDPATALRADASSPSPPAATPAKAGETGEAGRLVRFQLTVKNPFRWSRPEVKVPTARETLTKQLGQDLLEQIRDVVEGAKGAEEVTFAVNATLAHEVRRKLWKYSLEELA